jgi:hypothetical protein
MAGFHKEGNEQRVVLCRSKVNAMDETTETMTIATRSDFALWAIERAKAIVAEEGGNLAIATRDRGDEEIAASANALGQAIVDALLAVFDGLMEE